MPKHTYSLVLILPNRTYDYYNYWTKKMKVNDSGEELHPGMLAKTVLIESKNKSDAEARALTEHPNHTIDYKATKKLD